MWKSAVWLGIPQTEIECKKIFQGDLNGRFAYYRCDLEFNQPAELVIAITANSRYRFWVNGKPVLSGPCKGDRYRHYYEKVVLTDYLQQGLNRFAAQVLLTDSNSIVNQGDERTPILSVASLPAGHRLAIEGQAFSQNGELLADLTTGTAPWRVRLDNSYYLKCKPINVNLGAIAEDIDFALTPSDWKTGKINPADWGRTGRTRSGSTERIYAQCWPATQIPSERTSHPVCFTKYRISCLMNLAFRVLKARTP